MGLTRLAQVNDLIIEQSTPLRVLHRRSLLSRPKTIHWLKVRRFINPHFFVLLLNTSSGTYIKEFVHGDLGRTCPSLGSLLGCKADILQLDVMDVHFEEKSKRPALLVERGNDATVHVGM